MSYALRDYLDLSVGEAEEQWRALKDRRIVGPHENQVDYVPIETLLCAAAMVTLGTVTYGSGLAKRGPTPIPQLASLFKRRPTSVTSKMANLDGGRPRGGTNDQRVWEALSANPERLFDLYRVILATARRAGIGIDALPDFLGAEDSDRIVLLGQDELDDSAIEAGLREAFERHGRDQHDEGPSERDVIQRARIGQHRFARAVLSNCGWQCVFCGFSLGEDARRPLLRASHIKPWKAGTDSERRDPKNGVAACPTHDAAFDAGDLSLDDTLRVVVSGRLRSSTNRGVRTAFEAPVLFERIALPPRSLRPRVDYVRWHRAKIFVA